LKAAVSHGVINPDMKRADLQGWLKACRLWLVPDRPAMLDRRGAEVVGAQDEAAFAALEAAWTAAPDLQTAWTNATDMARERFVREVLRVRPVPPPPSQVAAVQRKRTRTMMGSLTSMGLTVLGWSDR
jgi:hypothetical protein